MSRKGLLPVTPTIGPCLYTDGGVIGKNPSPHGGTWAWCLVEDNKILDQASGVITPGDLDCPIVTNNNTELFAALRGISSMPKNWCGTLYTDSKVTLTRLTRPSPFKGCPPWLRDWCVALRRGRQWRVSLLAGHPTRHDLKQGHAKRNGSPVSPFNAHVDALCNQAAKDFGY